MGAARLPQLSDAAHSLGAEVDSTSQGPVCHIRTALAMLQRGKVHCAHAGHHHRLYVVTPMVYMAWTRATSCGSIDPSRPPASKRRFMGDLLKAHT